ncbi:hypothetical protein KI387_037485, partial [Taxus chinensis]
FTEIAMDNDNEEYKCGIDNNIRDSSDGCSYFLRVMRKDFTQKLSIPAAFVPKLRKETSKNMVLQGPSAKQWVVKLWDVNTQLEFRQGWEEFVHHHAIEPGDFLIFKYVCRSYFKVRIFGKNGCEKNITSSENSHKRCRDTTTATQSPIASDSDEEMSDHTTTVAGDLPKNSRQCQPSLVGKKQSTVKFAESEQTSCGKLKPYYASARPPALETEDKKAFQDANSFTSDKPFCLVVMKPSHVYSGFCVNFQTSCQSRLKLPKETREVILVDPNLNQWRVRYIWSRCKGAGSLSAGWRYLAINNNLEVGDTCVFERVDKIRNSIKLKVYIFKAAKNCSPCKNMKSETITETPAGCRRRSLRFARRCNSAKPPKKEHMCDESSVDGEESVGKDTEFLSAETSSPHDVNFEPEDLMIISDSSDDSHAMTTSSGALNLSPKPNPQETLMTNSTFPVGNPEGDAPSWGGALSPEEATSPVNIASLTP